MFVIKLEEVDSLGEVVRGGLKTFILPDKAPSRDYLNRNEIHAKSINNENLSTWEQGIDGTIHISLTNVSFSFDKKITDIHNATINDNKIFKYTDQRGDTFYVYIGNISRGEELANSIESMDITIRITSL